MPYPLNADLPPAVQRALPSHAQDIYRRAFNNAWATYGPAREDIVHRVAWAAVKRKYEKRGGRWAPRDALRA
ncbi:MAG: ChaB family protein [Proteobacteria bacterium]|nr:ChaB family protein [Pseudomonadota bacterium]